MFLCDFKFDTDPLNELLNDCNNDWGFLVKDTKNEQSVKAIPSRNEWLNGIFI